MDNNVGKDFGLIERNEIIGKNYTIRETIIELIIMMQSGLL